MVSTTARGNDDNADNDDTDDDDTGGEDDDDDDAMGKVFAATNKLGDDVAVGREKVEGNRVKRDERDDCCDRGDGDERDDASDGFVIMLLCVRFGDMGDCNICADEDQRCSPESSMLTSSSSKCKTRTYSYRAGMIRRGIVNRGKLTN